MSFYPAFRMLEGETLDLHICSTIDAKDAAALLYYCGGDDKACVVQPCSLALSPFQLHVGPLGRDECIQLPYLSIASWGISRASAAVTKAFTQVQQAEETARAVAAAATAANNEYDSPTTFLHNAAAAAGGSAVSGNGGFANGGGGSAAVPMLSPPSAPQQGLGQTTPQPLIRPRVSEAPPTLFVVTLQTKHVWLHRLLVQSERVLKNIKAHLGMAHCLARVSDLPAFVHGEERRRRLGREGTDGGKCAGTAPPSNNGSNRSNSGTAAVPPPAPTIWNTEFGWNVYAPQREFTRQLCLDASRPALAVATEADMQEGRIGVQRDLRPWFGLVDLREEERQRDTAERSADFFYTSSPTYPDLFVQPKLVDRELLTRAMSARSRARVPAVSYVCLRTGAVLARSSQPLMRSAQLGADSDVCYTLVNMGYAPRPMQTGAATAASASPAPSLVIPKRDSSATGTTPARRAGSSGSGRDSRPYHGSPATLATTNAVPPPPQRAVRPPSLFDDEDERDLSASPVTSVSGPAGSTPVPAAAGTAGVSASLFKPSFVNPSDANFIVEASPQSPMLLSTSGASKVLFVADCRPQMTATANAQMGGGYESGSFYTFCQTNFFDIDNIYGVAKAFEKMRNIVARYHGNTAEKTFLRRLYDADWLAITQRVLVCAVTVAQSLQNGVSCLVHCTDGWDRTSQCTALAMLLVDPYYRTVIGLCTLIEKEFSSFGHKFAERCGHQLPGRTSFFTHSGVASSDTEQAGTTRLDASPVFLHFLDALFQVHRQYPTCFEFTTDLLAYLSEAVYGCLHGTFLCNGEQERRLEGARLRTASVWTDVLRQTQREKKGEVPLRFVNVVYDASTAWKFISQRCPARATAAAASGASTSATPRPPAPLTDFVLLPNCSSKRLVFWEALYTREDADHYLGYNPNVHPLRRQQKVSWGTDFDAFLESELAAACADRVRELPALTALETYMAKEATKPAVAALTASSVRSAWCVYDASNCFSCYRPFSMWSTKTQCVACKQYFCADCHVHDCMMQQY